jgi:hypothetical protein
MLVTTSGAVQDPRDRPEAVTTVAVQRVSLPAVSLSDEMTMVLVGTALIGLASLVRRSA